MPDEKRIDMTRDLSPEGTELAMPLIAEMVELEARWVASGEEEDYQRWREVVSRLQEIVNEHHADRTW